MDASSLVSTNPVLDYQTMVRRGVLVNRGQPLQKIVVPPIRTLIYESTDKIPSLAMVTVQTALAAENVILNRDAETDATNVGIGLDISLLTLGSQAPSQISSTMGDGRITGRQIPTNMHEARAVINQISPTRAGAKNEAYGITELRQIARNLNIAASGKKEELANRIRKEVMEFFNLQI